MDKELASEELTKTFEITWTNHANKTDKRALLYVICKAMTADLLKPVIPRLLYVG